MKSPYKIAKELGISHQAVYKRLTADFIAKLHNHVVQLNKGKLQLDAVAEAELKNLFNKVAQPVVQPDMQQVEQPVVQPLSNQKTDEEVIFLREQIKTLQNELTQERQHSRDQAERVTSLADRLAQLNENQQKLLGMEQTRISPALLTSAESGSAPMEAKKRNFFRWILHKE